MTTELAFLIALGTTLSVSLVVSLYLHRPLFRILTDLCGNEERARFWVSYSHFVIWLVPAVATMLGHQAGRPGDPTVFVIVDQMRIALLGLLGAVTLIAMGIAMFIRPHAAPGHVAVPESDLHRLLARVEELRARLILNRPAAEREG